MVSRLWYLVQSKQLTLVAAGLTPEQLADCTSDGDGRLAQPYYPERLPGHANHQTRMLNNGRRRRTGTLRQRLPARLAEAGIGILQFGTPEAAEAKCIFYLQL
jgi:hypothetical protein